MHILKIHDSFSFAGQTVEAGSYIVEDVSGAQLLVMAGGGEMEPLKETRKPIFGDYRGFPGELLHDGGNGSHGMTTVKSILFGRTGGLGDLTLLTPVLREIKRRWPSVKIGVASIKELQQSIENLPFIDELLSYPVSLAKAQEYDGWCWLENAVEKNEDAKTLHSVDCVAKFIGLPLPEDMDKVQSYIPTDKERSEALWAYPRIPGIKRLAIQVGASARCRTYPQSKLGMVVAEMLKKKWEVFLLGAPGEVKVPQQMPPGLRIVTDGYTFRQRAALLETCDCVLAPDSSLTHIAGALGIPCVALYGPFPWQVRTAYNPKTHALTRREGFSCAPCFHHERMGEQFPKNCPTRDKGFCGVLEAIEPSSIVAKIEEIATGDNVVAFKP